MREIKFRGKTQYGEWVEGGYLKTDDNTNNPMQHRPLNLRHQIWSYWSGDWNMGGWSPMDVLPETIGQFTGLLDKNGKKIFEGDIIEHDALYGSVIFEDGMFSISSNAKTQFCNCRQPMAFHDINEMEVIGNIHDNPELIK